MRIQINSQNKEAIDLILHSMKPMRLKTPFNYFWLAENIDTFKKSNVLKRPELNGTILLLNSNPGKIPKGKSTSTLNMRVTVKYLVNDFFITDIEQADGLAGEEIANRILFSDNAKIELIKERLFENYSKIALK